MRRVLPLNGDQNSRIEIILGVIRNLLDDIAALVESSPTLRVAHEWGSRKIRREVDRDFDYVRSRTTHEGLEFLTISLPRLGKWYDGVISGQSGEMVEGFKPHHTHSQGDDTITCPLFTRMLSYVLHDLSGSALEKARVIRAYRSLFYLVYKMETPLTDEAQKAALQKWRQNETELEEHSFPSYYDKDLVIAREIIADIIKPSLEEKIFRDLTPKHGPGAVAGGENNVDKWVNAHYIKSLHSVYPRYDLYFGWRSEGRVSPTMAAEIIAFVKRSSEQRAISRLLFVPKDSRGPRTISCEPKELMFVQQGVAMNLMKVLHFSSHGRINFVDQSINGRLALTSSQDGEFATIDLQDASDRVSTRLVELMFPEWSHRYLRALRSEATLLPDGTLFEGHQKYAPMGSALCFPVESLVFWALAVAAGVESGMTAADAKASTYVYGDDIIIRPQVFEPLVRIFTKFALKVNVDKSYVEGPFRESCGVDAWNGFIITPFKIKKDICRRSLDGPLAAAVCEYASTCFALDYRETGEYFYTLVNKHFPGVPKVAQKLGILSIVDELGAPPLKEQVPTGWSARYCCAWVKGWVLSTPKEPLALDGLSRLLRAYYGDWEEHDPSQVVVPRATKIRKRKTLVEGYGVVI